MLTDYHVHLRPDEPGTTAQRFFTPANAERYREAAAERGIVELGVSEHVYRFRQALAVWDHQLWRTSADDDLDAYCAFVREETDLRLGIEADFVPGREDRMAELLEAASGTTCSARSTSSATRRSTTPTTTSGPTTRRAPTACGAATSSGSARRRAAACSTSSPTPTW